MKCCAKVIAPLTLGLLLSADLAAQIQNTVQIHGFGGWAAGRTDNQNEYGSIANKETPMDNYYFALSLTAQLQRNVSIFVQPSWQTNLKGEEVNFDYVFMQWMLAKPFGLRLGKIKNPVGYYSEVLNVGTLRPFYLIPQGKYIASSQSYIGMGLTGTVGMGPVEMSYDLFGGLQEFKPIIADFVMGVNPVTHAPIFVTIHVSPEGREFVGVHLLFQTPIPGFNFGVNACSMNMYIQFPEGPKMRSGDRRTVFYVGQAEYKTDRIQVRTEVASFDDPNTKIHNGYAEAAYKITSHWQVAADYDWAKFTVLSTSGNVNKHNAVGAALDYWVSPDMVFKLNHYWVEGNGLCKPSNAAQSSGLGSPQKNTKVWVLGMQFAF